MIRTILGIRSIAIIALIVTVIMAYQSRNNSSGDTFAVGEVDIMIDNESYYNGSLNPDTSWDLRDLTIEKFFNFLDVKPQDYGEDTVSIHVLLEDTYLCADVTLTSNDENGCNEPESLEDITCGNPGTNEGELADSIEFMWWADDGDNVFENDETIISAGPVGSLTLNATNTLALADTDTNIWTGVGGPVAEDSTLYIGKAWCYGSLSPAALPQDGEDDDWSPALDNDNSGLAGEPADGGFTCEGEALSNETQTDSLSMDVSFNSVQAFGNDGYLCSDGEPPEPDDPPPLVEDFGDGDCLKDIPDWDEDNGESCITGTVAKNDDGADDNSVSPDGGRFGLLSGNNGFICRSVDATGFENLELQYYWRGDLGADDGETGSAHFFTTGDCAAPGPLTTLATYELDDGNNNVAEPWSSLQTIPLPGSLDNTTFFIRFTADSNSGNESFRLDGIVIDGTPI